MNKMENAVQKIPDFIETFVWCLSLSWNASPIYTTFRVLAELAKPVLIILVSFLGKNIIDILARADSSSRESLLFLLFMLFAMTILRAAISKLAQYAQDVHDELVQNDISLFIINRSLDADLEYFDNPSYHDKLRAMNRDAYSMSNMIWNAISAVSSAVSFIGIFVVICNLNYLYGLSMIAAVFPTSFMISKYTRKLHKLRLEQTNADRRLSYSQAVSMMKQFAQGFRLFGTGSVLMQRYEETWAAMFVNKRKLIKHRSLVVGILECLPEIVVCLIGVDIALKVLAGNATVGDYSLYTGLIGQLWMATSALFTSFIRLYDDQVKIENFRSVDRFVNKVKDDGDLVLASVESIEFCSVVFSYPGNPYPTIDDVSFRLHKEQNGSGKSTLIKLLLRMYDPDSGYIKINDCDIKRYTLKSLRSNFSVYFQEMVNFSFSLRDNFLLTDKERPAGDSDIESALKAAGCDDYFSVLANGYDTGITRYFDIDGVELSGGQHQKLALARVLFRQHSALVLDEPSSSLDPKAEHDFFEVLREVTEGKMTIFTSHRLSNIFLADRIIVLERGRIIEDGSQTELLRNKQRFSELYEYQHSRFVSVKD